jgi:hypothetical protein
MSSNNDIINDFKKLAESIRKSNKDNFDNQVLSLQFYNKTKDIKFLYMVLAHLISEDKYLNDNVLKIEERIVTIIEHIIILQDRSERTIKRLLEISKRVKESESLQEELNVAYAKAQQDNRKMKEEILNSIKLIMESAELKRKEVERAKDESQSDKEKHV